MNVAIVTQDFWTPPVVDPPPTGGLTTVEMGELPIPMESFFAASKAWRKRITDYTPYDDPTFHTPPAGATWTPVPAGKTNCRAWVEHLCDQMGFDPDTGAWTGV